MIDEKTKDILINLNSNLTKQRDEYESKLESFIITIDCTIAAINKIIKEEKV